jgi:hypothetical protein
MLVEASGIVSAGSRLQSNVEPKRQKQRKTFLNKKEAKVAKAERLLFARNGFIASHR